MQSREAFPSCEICGAVVRRTSMHIHHAWHLEMAHEAASAAPVAPSPARSLRS